MPSKIPTPRTSSPWFHGELPHSTDAVELKTFISPAQTSAGLRMSLHTVAPPGFVGSPGDRHEVRFLR